MLGANEMLNQAMHTHTHTRNNKPHDLKGRSLLERFFCFHPVLLRSFCLSVVTIWTRETESSESSCKMQFPCI